MTHPETDPLVERASWAVLQGWHDKQPERLKGWLTGRALCELRETISDALARERAAGYASGIEAAAKVAKKRAARNARDFDKAVIIRRHEHQTHFAARHREANEIADIIRNLGGPNDQ